METIGETHVGSWRERAPVFSPFPPPPRLASFSPGFPSPSVFQTSPHAAGISPRLWIKAPNEAGNGLPRATGRLPSRYRGHNIKSPLWRFVSGHWCHIGINFTHLLPPLSPLRSSYILFLSFVAAKSVVGEIGWILLFKFSIILFSALLILLRLIFLLVIWFCTCDIFMEIKIGGENRINPRWKVGLLLAWRLDVIRFNGTLDDAFSCKLLEWG